MCWGKKRQVVERQQEISRSCLRPGGRDLGESVVDPNQTEELTWLKRLGGVDYKQVYSIITRGMQKSGTSLSQS